MFCEQLFAVRSSILVSTACVVKESTTFPVYCFSCDERIENAAQHDIISFVFESPPCWEKGAGLPCDSLIHDLHVISPIFTDWHRYATFALITCFVHDSMCMAVGFIRRFPSLLVSYLRVVVTFGLRLTSRISTRLSRICSVYGCCEAEHYINVLIYTRRSGPWSPRTKNRTAA
jgi:hypothetical protein